MTGLLRRTALGAAMVALTVLVVVTVPLWLVVAAAASPLVSGRLRPLRLVWLLLLHLLLETAMIVVMLVLWVASGFGWAIRRPWFERAHYGLMRCYLVVMFRAARRVLRLQITVEGDPPRPTEPGGILVLSRHAGPGDSFILVYALLHWYGREPRVVLKDTMSLDPAIGLLLHRLPARFISPNPGSSAASAAIEAQITELATGLDDDDAFVIFPEGGNFTEARRDRAIASLHRLGLHAMARRAERMTNVLAPRPGGVLAALDAAPEADVALVGHTGLDHMVTVTDIWRELPMDKEIVMRWWRVPRAEVPQGRDERIDWLFTRWEQIDAWIDEHQPADLPRGRLPAEPVLERPAPMR
ncbi:1-acyl-sn-glycerol-3-phosphate acyltransferase [Humibacillus xanthopallidus]|uniref:Acyltransferase-like protein n=1 Tax=Humibacillus xanthopallidus TaxID=412689 RepID=A0A543HVP9_9MICO|nr:1-acyl-sn-glycerol-3-phosphate acyltransferase [Humibacillus xanthopallidus]TQM62374.1 acyltransferase-like protein [Humibacillus xanthopallidus]